MLGKEKPILSDVITEKEYITTIKGMEIDQNKEYKYLKTVRKESRYIKKTHAYHNVLILKVDLMKEMQKEAGTKQQRTPGN